MKRIIVTDSGDIKKVATGDQVANCYAQFAYGSNSRTEAEAITEAQAAAKQLQREIKEYR